MASNFEYRAEIDGLRAVAVVPVILFHAGLPALAGGFLGVDIFFVISGFLITGILMSEMENGRYSLLTFYERRAKRILPALFVVVLCCIPAAWFFLLPPDLENFAQSVVAVATFCSNVFFWQESGYFDTASELKPLLHTWSLAVEEQFYIVFPLFLALAFAKFRKALVPVLGVIFITSLTLAQVGSSLMPSAAFYLLPARGWELLIGSFAAIYLQKGAVTSPLAIRNFLSVFGLAAIAYAIFVFDESTPFPSLYSLVPTVGTMLVLLFALPGTLANRLLSNRLIVGFGLISYSAYLWHQPLIAFYNYRFESHPEFVLLAAALSFPLAWLSWKYVETPFRNKSLLKASATTLAVSAVSLSAMAVLGVILLQGDGLKARYSQSEQRVFKEFAIDTSYLTTRFNSLNLKPFKVDPGKTKVLIIGDSYGQDLVNSLYETGYDDALDISTFYIPRRCGNLLIDGGLIAYQEPKSQARCAKRKGYSDPHLRHQMTKADEIWLVSSWQPWSSKLLPASLNNIRKLTDATIIVFGRKHLGTRELRNFHQGGLSALLGRRNVPGHLVSVQKWMSEKMPPLVPYVDVQMLLCGNYEACTNDTGDGLPLTFDGTHLTPAGAHFQGERLSSFLAPYLNKSISNQPSDAGFEMKHKIPR